MVSSFFAVSIVIALTIPGTYANSMRDIVVHSASLIEAAKRAPLFDSRYTVVFGCFTIDHHHHHNEDERESLLRDLVMRHLFFFRPLLFFSNLVSMTHFPLRPWHLLYHAQRVGPNFALCSGRPKPPAAVVSHEEKLATPIWEDESAESTSEETSSDDLDSLGAPSRLKGGGGSCMTSQTGPVDSRMRYLWHNASKFKFAFSPTEDG